MRWLGREEAEESEKRLEKRRWRMRKKRRS